MRKTNNITRIRSVWRFGKKYIPLFCIAEICILVSYAISILLPLNLTRLTDQVLYGRQYALLPEVIRSYIVLFSTATIFNFIYAFVWQYLNNHYIVDIKTALFRKMIYAKASFLSNMNSGDMMSRIDGDSEQFIHVVQRNLFHFVNSLIMCTGILYMVARIHPGIAVMLAVAALLPIVITRLCGRFTEKYAQKNREITGAMTGRLFEILKGLRELRLVCADWWVSRQIITPLKTLITLGNRIRRVDFFVNKGIYLINHSASILIYGFSVKLILGGEMTIGLFLAVIEYIALLHKKFNWMLRIYLDWFSRKVSIDRVNEVLDQDTESNEGQEITDIERIDFHNVSFSYNERNPVLDNISFTIGKGQHMGFVGSSGVGKTTLMALLMNFYQPTAGEILINGIPLRDIKPSSLRKLIGIVSQDIMLFDESVRYNLSLGGTAGDEEIWRALKAVHLEECIQNLPNGLDTIISSAASDLSGGQKQRLMIARLLLKNTAFIILDEATSALDVETEEAILDALASFSSDTTLLIISHRLAAVRHCCPILVLNNRRVENAGTHEQLLETSAAYHLLFGREKT